MYKMNVDINELVVEYSAADNFVNKWYKRNGSESLVNLIENIK